MRDIMWIHQTISYIFFWSPVAYRHCHPHHYPCHRHHGHSLPIRSIPRMIKVTMAKLPAFKNHPI